MHCSTHNIDYSVRCSACGVEEAEFRRSLLELEQEIEAQRRHLSRLEHERDELYQRQNPGEYDCPYCRYQKLKIGSPQCPSCQREITQDQWRPIYEIEKAQAKLWAMERAQEAKELPETKKGRSWKTWVTGYVLPALTVLLSAAIYWFFMR